MKNFIFLIVSLTFLAACKPDTDAAESQAHQAADPVVQELPSPTQDQPMAAKRPHTMTLHGHERVDEYYWLRDDTREDPEVLAYLEEENAHFDKVMEPTVELQKTLFEEMTGRLDPDESSVPYEQGGYWYYDRYEPKSEYAI